MVAEVPEATMFFQTRFILIYYLTPGGFENLSHQEFFNLSYQ